MNSKNAFKKCRDNDFAICSIDVSKGWIGIEPEEYSYGLYFYVLRGSCKFGVPFKDGYDVLKKGDFYCAKNKLYDHFLIEALEDFCMVGFSSLDKKQDWNGKLVSGNTVKEERDSILICLDGSPVVENQELSIFDYGNLDAGIEYEVDAIDGILAVFTKN